MTKNPARLATAHPWVTAAVVVVVGGASAGGYLLAADNGGSSAAAQVTTRTVTVSKGTVRESVSTTGTLAPADEKDVDFASSGTVTSVRVSEGDKVKKGQLLGTISKLSLKATLATDRAALANVRAQLASAKDDSSATKVQISADQVSVQTAKASVHADKKALRKAKLRAPISGTVATVNVSKGGSVGSSAGSSGSGSTGSTSTTSSSSSSADFVIIGGKKWTASASVDDTEVGLIKKGDQAQLTLDSARSTVFGTVKSVSILASDSSSSSSASYPVVITVTGSPSGLHDGESATAVIIYKQKSNVLTVSASAIHSDGTAKYVYLDENGKKVKRTVTTGISSSGSVEITKGLTAGEKVYVETVTLPGTTTGNSSTESGSNSGRFPGSGNFPGGGSGGFPGGNVGGGPVGGN